ncbi:NADH-quinone oxidoreductase subunit NuoN [Oceanomicrobium pacificus]|uniref:NADH-quinone oxidoreductase subunit N n=1 Tax=Oceanomicrobium pacificus TaxID=2692916 RepID=A0A6B0TWH7_9RHOB|nr:NADH-quinone oxidoreductase subunit NuoN [Oceanomicrobium pacificus]MXU65612.1 NADH-quinone oxidoreductase subunit NuoN [Oceanomicrobium pacificus]
MIAQDISVVLPELVLAIYAMAALMWGVFMGQDKQSDFILHLTAGLLILVGFWIGFSGEGTQTAFGESFVNDGFARFSKVMILWGSAVMLLLSREYLIRNHLMKFEFPVLVTLATLGMMMMVSAGDLMALYMGLELQSLSLYVVAAFRRDSLRSTEAGLKYFVLGALSSGLLLYGASLVYGYAGTTLFSGIASVVDAEGISLGLLFGLVFLCTGMAFKVSAAPFHMWTPDVYEGSPTPVTLFFATAPKVAAAGMFARVLFDGFGNAVADWQQILIFLSVLSMFLGSIAAIGQSNIKRLMAYSSIAHMGFALMGLAAGTEQGVQALLIYLAIYVTMNVGVFAFILNMEHDGRPVTDINALGMYSTSEPARALALAVLMFSLAGIPPLVGFFGKFYVLKAAVDAGLVWFAVAGVIASVIGAFYYLRIIYLMYFGTASDVLNGRMPLLHYTMLMASALIMVVGIVNLLGIEGLAAQAAATLVN